MSSTSDRHQREAARAKLQREMNVKAEAARKRKRLQAILGSAFALLLVVGLAVWGSIALFGADDKTPSAQASAEPQPGACQWLTEAAGGNPNVTDVGTPPAGEPRSGTRTMDIVSNQGDVSFELDVAKAPCTSASFAYLADKKFYDNTTCHRLTTQGIFVLQCGDPSATGMGGPTYKYGEENLPTGKTPAYPAGTLAMAKTSEPNTTGSQFFIVYQDTDLPAQYTVVGKVTKGLDIIQKVAAKGAAQDGQDATDGKPKEPFDIKTLQVGPVVGGETTPEPAPTASGS